jgi:hypothetical protein
VNNLPLKKRDCARFFAQKMKYLLLIRHLPVIYKNNWIKNSDFLKHVSMYDTSQTCKDGYNEELSQIKKEILALGSYKSLNELHQSKLLRQL